MQALQLRYSSSNSMRLLRQIASPACLCGAAQAFAGISTRKAPPTTPSREAFLQVAHRHVSSSSRSSSSISNSVVDVDESSIFDRKAERTLLKKYRAAAPSAITVLQGPRSCGKTSILREYVNHSSSGSICYINFRDIDCKTPAGLAGKLENQGLQDLITSLPDAALKGLMPAVWSSLTRSFQDDRDVLTDALIQRARSVSAHQKTPISKALGSIEAFLSRWQKVPAADKLSYNCSQWPVIILDEASRLMSWSTDFPSELSVLRDFMIKNTYELNRVHVLLVTSDCAFQRWMQDGEL
jgi:Cdc6-like AAA superfamily ATPase